MDGVELGDVVCDDLADAEAHDCVDGMWSNCAVTWASESARRWRVTSADDTCTEEELNRTIPTLLLALAVAAVSASFLLC